MKWNVGQTVKCDIITNNGLSQSNRADWDSYIAWSIAVITVKQNETSQSSRTNRMKIAVRVDLQHQSQSETSQPEGSTALAVKQMQTITRGTYCPHTSTTSQ